MREITLDLGNLKESVTKATNYLGRLELQNEEIEDA